MKTNKKILLILTMLAFLITPAQADSKKKVLFYRHPMNPSVSSPVPAKDDMGMDYIPVYQDEMAPADVKPDAKTVCVIHECPMEREGKTCPMMLVAENGEEVECPICKEKIKASGELKGMLLPAGYASVLISPHKQQLIGIQSVPAEKKELLKTSRVSARVAYDPDLYAAQIEFLKEFRIAQGTLRNRDLAFKNLYDSRWEAPRVEVAKSKLILAGMDEVSIQALVEKGKADESLLYLNPKGDVWVYADVFEYEAPFIKKGDTVKVEIPSMPEKTYQAQVNAIGSMVDTASRRIRVRILLKNEEGAFKPEMLLNAVIESPLGLGIAVPESAVFLTGKSALVFVDKGNGLFEPREVTIGPKAGEFYSVTRGVMEGERVVVNGNFLLDSESRLKAAISAASASAQAGGGAS